MITAAIGGIGLPEALPCLEHLLKVLEQPKLGGSDPQVKCMAVWALGRLACLRTIKLSSQTMLKVLKDQFYKVRATACGALV